MYKLTQKLVLAISVSISAIAVADDIDIFDTVMPVNSNALVVMDMSGSMRWGLNDEQTPADPADSRKNVLHMAIKSVLNKLDDPNLPNINIGISSFSGNDDLGDWSQDAHGITYPVKSLSDDADTILDSNSLFTHPGISYLPDAAGGTTKDYIGDTFPSTWVPKGATPIVDSLYEAARYYRGNNPYSGWRIPSHGNSAHPSTYTGLLKEVPILSCPAGDPRRYTCSGSSCNEPFKLCEVEKDHAFTCWGSSCVNNEETNNGATCGTSIQTGSTTCPENVTMCGDATSTSDCTPDNQIWDAYCSLASASACEGTGLLSCAPSEAGGFKCKRNVTIYSCPIKKYPCTKDITVCTSCPPTEVIGPAKYNSPIDNKCSINSIVLLTDGEPTKNKTAWKVSDYIGSTYNNNCAVKTGDDFRDYGRCGKELAKFLATEDNSSTVDEKQIIRTHTIGFALQKQKTKNYLQEIATAGKGKYVTADTPDALADALYKTITYFSRARSFSSPSYKVNTSTFLTHDKYAYVPLFDRDINEAWSGNLKKYEVKDGTLYGKDDAGVSVQATDASGRLMEDVRDLWATGPSTDVVTSGGAAGLLSHSSRTIYTDNSGSLVNINSVSQAQLNAADATEKSNLIKYIRGENPDGSDRKHMGDIIHSKPLQLLTSKTEGVIFVGSDEGYLHAIKTSTTSSDDGKELFAYMPKELLKNIKPQYTNDGTNSHSYGVDGEMTLWHDDTNHNGIKESGETAILYFGLRRGGKAYYALDVTNPTAPVLVWKISNTGSFSNLGFTWSKPKLAMLKYKNGASLTAKPEPVLIFGGGYVDDNHNEADDSGTGANVYIVNAKTGSLLLRVGGAIQHAIPGNIRIIDFDRNGSVDRLYFADTGANIWRVDLNADSAAPYDLSKAKLTKFASLGGAATAADKRKFFNEPDVAIFQHYGSYAVSVSIGSGMRPKPLDSVVTDYFYMLLDENVFKVPPSTFQTITIDKLKDAPLSLNDNLLSQLTDVNAKKGWKLKLDSALNGLSGEKVLSTSLTFQNKVLFTTFGVKSISTITVDSNNCGVSNNNSSRLYALDLLTGKAAINLNSSDSTFSDATDSSIEVTTDEILDTPKITYGDFESENGGPCTKDDCIRPFEIHAGNVPAVATNKTQVLKPISIDKTLPRVYWIDQEK